MRGSREALRGLGRWLEDLYALDLQLDPVRFMISPKAAREWLGDAEAVPHSGVLVREDPDAMSLGLYIDPNDENDTGVLVEEASHLLCVAWHARRNRPVSRLVLELQGEIDRYAYARLSGNNPFSHLEHFSWQHWVGDEERGRYETARRAALRYCRSLARRFPQRRDLPSWRGELCSFYRASPEAKLRVAQALSH